ncbi:50S ribosomal protein L30 [Clostridium sp. CAG:813]|nr:50S ribosomal protein L30 [Clostridium sp. CAG:813]
MTDKKANSIKIKLVRSLIGTPEAQRRVVRGLGLTKKDQVVEHFASATIMGMVNKVSHLVEIVK